MFSYFAITAIESSTPGRISALVQYILDAYPEYRIVFRDAQMVALVTGEYEKGVGVYSLSNQKGVIFGTLFERTEQTLAGSVDNILSSRESREIVHSQGKHLIEHYWGMYTAIISDYSSRQLSIVRDPTGYIPTFFADVYGCRVFFSDAEHFRQLRLLACSVNFEHVISFLKCPFLDYADTGLNEIGKVLPGQVLLIRNGSIECRQYWHPRHFCGRATSLEPEMAADALRRTVTECVYAWSSHFNKVCVRLSGGLDSSIILSVLKSVPDYPDILALNYYSEDHGNADERSAARMAAAHASVPLTEKRDRADDVDLTLVEQFAFSAEPVRCRPLLAYGPYEKSYSELHGVEAFFTGEGGDGVFYQGLRNSAADFVWHNGYSGGFFRQCAYEARLSRKSFWSVLFEAGGSRFREQQWRISDHAELPNSIASDEAVGWVDLQKRCAHWLADLEDLSPPKRKHVAMTRTPNYYRMPNSRQNSVRSIDPLMSQPILELVYSLPAYYFAWGGVDRGLARAAFTGVMHERNRLRQAKGGPDVFYREVFKRHVPYLREQMLDGMLVRHRILDRNKLERVLKEDLSAGSASWLALFEYIGAEHWMRCWLSQPDQQIAKKLPQPAGHLSA